MVVVKYRGCFGLFCVMFVFSEMGTKPWSLCIQTMHTFIQCIIHNFAYASSLLHEKGIKTANQEQPKTLEYTKGGHKNLD
jgi:hypothetical protein